MFKKLFTTLALVLVLCFQVLAFDTSFVRRFMDKEVDIVYGNEEYHKTARCVIVEIIDNEYVKGKTTLGYYYIEIKDIISIHEYSNKGIH